MELSHWKGSSLTQSMTYWSQRDQYVALAALSLLLLSVLGYVDLFPRWKTMRLAEQTMLKRVQRSTEMTLGYLLLNVKQFNDDEKLNGIPAYFIKAPISFTNMVKILLAESNCQISMLRQHDGADSLTDRYQQWHLQIRGDYQQISRFLSLLMQYAPFIEMQSIDIEKKQYGIELSAVIHFIHGNSRGDDESFS
jgi:hypothetical protein